MSYNIKILYKNYLDKCGRLFDSHNSNVKNSPYSKHTNLYLDKNDLLGEEKFNHKLLSDDEFNQNWNNLENKNIEECIS
jgi:hypothetical protein